MKNYQPRKLIIRKSGTFYTSAAIQPQMVNNKEEFEARSYFIYNGNKQENVTALTISNKWGAGVSVELLKVGEKRNTSLSLELGADEVGILIEYLQSIKEQLKNYTGEIVSKIN